MSGEYWEPWTPRIGDRVKVVLSPECPLPRVPQPVAGRRVEHHPQHDGMEGTVILYRPNTDHPYLVELPQIELDHCSVGAGYFAAIELQPLAADHADATPRGRGAE